MKVSTDRHLRLVGGIAASVGLAGFLAGGFLVLVLATGASLPLGQSLGDRYIRGVVLFTLEQAALSTLLSILGAIPLAVALHRARFAGRRAILRLFLLPQALPVLVGALAIIAVWGRNGVSDALDSAGLARLDVYGLSGILLAHVFFNLPLAARLMVAALDDVPAESWKLAGQLAFSPGTTFRLIEWPAIRQVLPAAASLVFMLCATSFTIVLVLGGGPGATTLEVAIYQSLRYDFDPGRAVARSLLQIALTALLVAAANRLGGDAVASFGLGGRTKRYDRTGPWLKLADGAVLAVGLLFIAAPFVAVVVAGLKSDLARLLTEEAVIDAALTSLWVALCAGLLALLVSLPILAAIEALASGERRSGSRLKRQSRRALEVTASLVLVVPPVVVGAGWFLGLRQVTSVFAAAPYVVVLTNAAMAVPFVVRILGPALATGHRRSEKLADSLGLTGLSRFRIVDWPSIRRPIGLAYALAVAISLGDLGAVALFGNREFTTLPYLLLQRMGSYRTEDAAGLALILGLLCLTLITVSESATKTRPGGGR